MRKRVLSIYRHKLSLNRGTPLRVSSLIKETIKTNTFDYFTASQDEFLVYKQQDHIKLSGNNLSDFIKLNTYINKHKIDIIVLHTLDSARFLLPLKFLYPRTKFVLEMHGFPEEEALLYEHISPIKYYCRKLIHIFYYWLVDGASTCSETATVVLSSYNKNVVTIFGGVDLSKFNPEVKVKYNFKKSADDIIIGYSGNVRKWQGLDFLIESFLDLVQNDSSFRLVLLLSAKAEIPKSEKITILDPVDHSEVGAINAGFDIMVIPRPKTIVNDLSFPSKLIEYMAMGKPIVASKTSDMDKIVTSGDNGFIYTPDSKKEFIEALQFLKSRDLRLQVGNAAYKTAEKHFTWNMQAEKFASLLKSV